jgi:hypothetical protein
VGSVWSDLVLLKVNSFHQKPVTPFTVKDLLHVVFYWKRRNACGHCSSTWHKFNSDVPNIFLTRSYHKIVSRRQAWIHFVNVNVAPSSMKLLLCKSVLRRGLILSRCPVKEVNIKTKLLTLPMVYNRLFRHKFQRGPLKIRGLNELSIPQIQLVSSSIYSNTSLIKDAGDVIEYGCRRRHWVRMQETSLSKDAGDVIE